MDRRRYLAPIAAGALTILSASPARAATSEELRAAIIDGPARNVILMIGDGMGDPEITLARYVALGAEGRLALDAIPLTGQLATWSITEDEPHAPDYDPDSASTATAWATGHKTSDGRIATLPATNESVPTILELAQAAGLRVGDVTTAELTDATPAALYAHVDRRECQGPADMAGCPGFLKSAGGPGSIAEQAIDHRVDVLLGGGRDRFAQRIPDGEPGAGGSVIDQATTAGYAVVTDLASLRAAVPERPLLGLFSDGSLTVDWGGEAAARPASGPQTCTQGAQDANEPMLADMTSKAIELLDEAGSEEGFFLQVEGGSIDKRAHAAQPCQQVGETVDFDDAVRVALDFAAADGQTLVIVTGDHGHSAQIVEPGSDPAGLSSILMTADGQPLQVTYGTSAGATAAAVSQQHTGSQIRIAALGPAAAGVVGLMHQTDLFTLIVESLRLLR